MYARSTILKVWYVSIINLVWHDADNISTRGDHLYGSDVMHAVIVLFDGELYVLMTLIADC